MRNPKWICFFVSGILALGLAGCTSFGSFPSLPFLPDGTPLITVPPVVLTPYPKPLPGAPFNLTATPAPLPQTIPARGTASPAAVTRTPASAALTGTTGAGCCDPATATPGPAAGWVTFVSAGLKVAVDYPADWRAVEQAAAVTFTSPQGAVIQLGAVETGGLPPEDFVRENQLPHTRCAGETNDYGLTAYICLDTLSRIYSADIPVEWPDGAKELLSLAMFSGGDVQVFQAMVRSVRPVS